MEFTFADKREPMDEINFVTRLIGNINIPKEEKQNRAKDLAKRYEILIKRHEKLYSILNTTFHYSFEIFDKGRIVKTKRLIDKTEKEMHYNNLERVFLEDYLARIEGY